jgi:hypothetical protein
MIWLLSSTARAQGDPVRVANGFEGSRAAPQLELMVVIGEEATIPTLFSRPTYLLFNAEGDLYVPDAGEVTIYHFHRDGTPLGTIGRQGQGPGEIQVHSEVHFNQQGDLVVVDVGSQRLNVFSADGDFISSSPIRTIMGDGDTNVNIIESDRKRISLGDGRYLRRALYFLDENTLPLIEQGVMAEPAHFEVINEGAGAIRRFGELRSYEDPMLMSVLNRICWDLSPDGRVAMAWKYSNEIQIYRLESGRLEQIITRRTAFRPDPNPRLELRRAAGSDGGSDVRYVTIADIISVDAAFDPEGRLWVLTMVVDREERSAREETGDYSDLVRLEVFDTGGDLLITSNLASYADHIAFDPFGDLWLMDSRYELNLRRYQVLWSGH